MPAVCIWLQIEAHNDVPIGRAHQSLLHVGNGNGGCKDTVRVRGRIKWENERVCNSGDRVKG